MNISKKLKVALKSLLSLQMGEVKTDKAALIFDGEELVEGMEVFVADAEAEDGFRPAETGDYVTEDGKTIKVVEGKVAEIVDPKAEVEEEKPAEVEEKKEEMANEDPAEPAEDPADEPKEDEEEKPSEEGRINALESRMDEIANGINGIVNAIAALEARIADAEAKIASVEAPATDPVEDKPQEEEVKQSRMSYLRKK